MADTRKLGICGTLCTVAGFGNPLLAISGGLFGIFGKSQVVRQAEALEASCQKYSQIVNQITQDNEEFYVDVENLYGEMQKLQQEYEEKAEEVQQQISDIYENAEEGSTEQARNAVKELQDSLNLFGNDTNERLSGFGLEINSKIDASQAFKGVFTEATNCANNVEAFGNKYKGKKRHIFKKASGIALDASSKLKDTIDISKSVSQKLDSKRVAVPPTYTPAESTVSLNTEETPVETVDEEVVD